MDVQAEADRLLALDEDGWRRELVVIGLRLGQQAQDSWDELHQLDREFLDDITGLRAGNVGPSQGSKSLHEHVDA